MTDTPNVVLAASVASASVTDYAIGYAVGKSSTMDTNRKPEPAKVCSCGCPKCHCQKPPEEHEVPVWMAYSVGALMAVLVVAWIVFLVIDLRKPRITRYYYR